jgi:hypothetical protein
VSAIDWISVGVALWLVGAVHLAVLLGRVIRGRDEQVPADAVPAGPEAAGGRRSLALDQHARRWRH